MQRSAQDRQVDSDRADKRGHRLREDRQATGRRVHSLFLIERQQLLVEPLAVAPVLPLQLVDARLELLDAEPPTLGGSGYGHQARGERRGCRHRLGLPRFDGQGWWLGQATRVMASSSGAVSNSSGVL
jgi:hypothetical protein